ncbi:hypothetical protein R5O24_14115 [Tenacibaculum maritimum]|uniref:hypothetical protein n=1 Tax=Tenacibaculum maritimum TaxID=107401 RepID=UPI00388F6949
MMEEFLPLITGVLTATNISAVIAWFFDSKKRKNEYALLVAQLKARETDNHKSVIDMYQEVLNDLKKYNDVRFQDLEKDLSQLKRNLNLWKEKYRSLKKEFEEYKTNHEGK